MTTNQTLFLKDKANLILSMNLTNNKTIDRRKPPQEAEVKFHPLRLKMAELQVHLSAALTRAEVASSVQFFENKLDLVYLDFKYLFNY